MEIIDYDVVARPASFHGMDWSHPSMVNTCNFDSFLTFLKIKAQNNLCKLPDTERSGSMPIIKAIGRTCLENRTNADMSKEVKLMWAKYLRGDKLRPREDFVGSSATNVWDKLKGETDVFVFYKCSTKSCNLAVNKPDINFPRQSLTECLKTGYPYVVMSSVEHKTGDIHTDLKNMSIFCKSCKNRAIRTWPILPSTTWLLRYVKESAVLNNPMAPADPCPSQLKTKVNTGRGVFQLSYVELIKTYKETDKITHQFSVFRLNGEYFLYDGQKDRGKFKSLGKTFTMDDLKIDTFAGFTTDRICWENAIYSKRIDAAQQIPGSNPPSRENSNEYSTSSSVISC